MDNSKQIPESIAGKKNPSKFSLRRWRYYRLFTLKVRHFKSSVFRNLKYFKLTIRPTIFACISVLIWLQLHGVSLYFKKDETYFEYAYAFFAGIHVLIAGMQLHFASHRKQKMQQAISMANEQMFKEYSCIRISTEIVTILIATSLSMYILLILYPFVTLYAGITFTFLTMFVLCIMWECAVEMSNPFKGVSKITKKEYERIFRRK